MFDTEHQPHKQQLSVRDVMHIAQDFFEERVESNVIVAAGIFIAVYTFTPCIVFLNRTSGQLEGFTVINFPKGEA